jgi:hypothetical protein
MTNTNSLAVVSHNGQTIRIPKTAWLIGSSKSKKIDKFFLNKLVQIQKQLGCRIVSNCKQLGWPDSLRPHVLKNGKKDEYSL